ncbi:sensor histidine kinase [Roseibium sp. TrichSKD4]|uniref:hybrid sensor histidine kinase/response regulator n=1 Tax=Roseibium sp. TrichSKD4 TaxID=744980 RepID=UPI0001E57665|nr:response regulator [Roseibium sp. TrichSKD4]EFO30057.1 sensor histidine kinase [Roseibium sp. TrichSKD4]
MLDDRITGSLVSQSKVPKAIRSKLEHYASLPLELMPMGITTWDADLKIDFLSSNYLRPASDFVKQTTLVGERITQIAQYLLLFIGAFLLLFVGYVYRFFLSPIFSEMIRMHKQIIQAKEHEMHYEKLRVLGQISGGVAHEFNNVLNIISGNAEMARLKSGPDAECARYVDKILDTYIRAATLTDQLLMYSRRRHLNEARVFLPDFFEGLEKTGTSLLDGDIALTMKSDAEVTVFVDPVFFETSVLNLVSNARDAILMGGGSRVKIFSSADGVGNVRIAVVDDGPGIPENALSLVREPFYSTKSRGRGTGLGLAMVEGFAAQANGRLEISSKPGRTEAALVLPVAEHSSHTSMASHLEADETQGLSGKRILIVEDRIDEFGFLTEHLRSVGCNVDIAKTVAEAGAKQGELWDIVLCDVDLGEGSGLDVYRSFQHKNVPPPFIFMTGNIPNEAMRDSVVRTKQRILMKPFRMMDMMEAIQKTIQSVTPTK